jgi:hypothetical protein
MGTGPGQACEHIGHSKAGPVPVPIFSQTDQSFSRSFESIVGTSPPTMRITALLALLG